MPKQSPSDYIIIPTHEGYILPLHLLLGLPYMQMRPSTPEERKTLSHAVLTTNMDWYPTVLNFTDAEYAEYNEWLKQIGC